MAENGTWFLYLIAVVIVVLPIVIGCAIIGTAVRRLRRSRRFAAAPAATSSAAGLTAALIFGTVFIAFGAVDLAIAHIMLIPALELP